MRHVAALCAAAISAIGLSTPHAAAQHRPVALALAPPDTAITYTAYAFGVVPVHAFFQQFTGNVRLDPANPAACDIDVTIKVASLQMDNAARRRLVLGAGMLDVARFPTMSFRGVCAPLGIEGRLTLHGVSRDLKLTLHQVRNKLICNGMIQRGDFGVDGLRGLVGARIRLQLTTPAPAGYLWHPNGAKSEWATLPPKPQGP
jgi:polyisoprenoid-binding protein YceI